MDDNSQHENGKHPSVQYKSQQIMTIIAERDGAIHERNMALAEKKLALAERDIAILQRDTAIRERDNAYMERDNAIAALHSRDNTKSNTPRCPLGFQVSPGMKHTHYAHQDHPTPQFSEAQYDTNDLQLITDALQISPGYEPAHMDKPERKQDSTMAPQSSTGKRKFEAVPITTIKKGVKLSKKSSNWKNQDRGLNQVTYNEATMPVPVCSCTGILRQCYKCGHAGWQSACCTNTMSEYPLPSVPNKPYARLGRKMGASAYNKLLSRLADQGHDLSKPVDLKDHWAKHGTNGYHTIR